MTQSDLPPSAATKDLHASFRWFLVGICLLGLAVGFFAGNSESPVIGVLLPLLFGLIGGASGLYITNANFESAEARGKLRLLGIALSGFVVPMLAGSAYGLMLRTGAGFSSFFPGRTIETDREPPLPSMDRLSANEAIELVLMRERLRALGATPEERQAILARVAKAQIEPPPPGDLEQILQHLGDLMHQTATQAGPKANSVAIYLQAYGKDFRKFADDVRKGEKPTPALIKFYFSTVYTHIDNRLKTSDEGFWAAMRDNDEFRRGLSELRFRLGMEIRKIDSNLSEDNPRIIQEVDKFLALRQERSKEGSTAKPMPSLGPHFAK